MNWNHEAGIRVLHTRDCFRVHVSSARLQSPHPTLKTHTQSKRKMSQIGAEPDLNKHRDMAASNDSFFQLIGVQLLGQEST